MHIALIAFIVAMVYLAVGLTTLFGGAPVRDALMRFPRNRIAGAVLAAVAIAWAAVLFRQSPLGWFETYRHTIPYLAVVIYLLTVTLVHELLAPRALGGLLLLVAAPVLDAIRWEPTAWRLALTVQAYLWVIAGMMLVFSPFRFRRVCDRVYQSHRDKNLTGGLIALIGLLMIILAMTVYA